MNYFYERCMALLLVAAICTSFSAGITEDFNQKATVFNITRSKDARQVVYKLNLEKDGTLDQEEPVEAFWVMYNERGQVEPLTWIQKELSYGLKFVKANDQEAEFHFAAYNKKHIYLKKYKDSFRAFAMVQSKVVCVEHIHVQFNGGTDWLPTVEYVQINSRDMASNEVVVEYIYP